MSEEVNMDVIFDSIRGGLANTDLLEELSSLYSKHYGIWGNSSLGYQGQRIKLSVERIRKWLKSDTSGIHTARLDGKLIGYAIANHIKGRYGKVSWVTQLVVHKDHRHRKVAKKLLFSIWGISTDYAWGLLSSNPYAIRALEKATLRRCAPKRIEKNKTHLINLGVKHLPYLTEENEICVDSEVSKVNTEFHVDHSDLQDMLENVISNEKPWTLGEIGDGWEWFAFTFRDQELIRLSKEEIVDVIDMSEDVTKQAYSKMKPIEQTHRWSRHTGPEVEFIVANCKIKDGGDILDLGCGNGRHSVKLAELGFNVTAVDYVGNLPASKSNLTFMNKDCRSLRLDKKFDSVLCLYDVVGSYAENKENEKILETVSCHLKKNCFALISVMNMELTLRRAKHIFSFDRDPQMVLKLPASATMEQTGDVFDPEYYAVDSNTSIVYRREQFNLDSPSNRELIVRDRRFYKNEIVEMCQDVGLDVKWARFVNAGHWDISRNSDDDKAKEILVLCQKL